ncbi:hypothetical protein DUNSADRAFT_6042 [Dunaliella salina]|uniref:Glutamine amidotransferase type-2 domain-containing protein n=1 Tax=Dunaliella salina TaxID=3046 RepID=A0ABQ7GP10_DUNSA|nr:hypothetical protein DUNSADRAFT_6042 [Dunaliella salina]|eukprot:KAF5836355.1 hypothetical protein DUNSADRAFT_6042 [Dunaliella salina]
MHMHTQAQVLQEELEFQVSAHPDARYTTLSCSGAGVVTMGDVATANTGKGLAAFQGTLTNLEDLSTTFKPNWGSETTVTAAQTAATTAAHKADGAPPPDPHAKPNAAEMVLWLYFQKGPSALSLLRGRFVTCVYDVQQMRVLAARDGTGVFPLFEAHTSKDSLMVSSSPEFLEGARDKITFEPGFFKYGWHAPPRRFDPAEFASHFAVDPRNPHHVHHRRSFEANQGILRRRSVDSAGSRRSSLDVAHHGDGGAASISRRKSLGDSHGHTSHVAHTPAGSHAQSQRNGSPRPWSGRRSMDHSGGGAHPTHSSPSHLRKSSKPGAPPLPPHSPSTTQHHSPGSHASGAAPAAATAAAAAAAAAAKGLGTGAGGGGRRGVGQQQAGQGGFHMEEHLNAKPFVPGGR